MKNIKKVLFYISLIPYVVLIFMCIYYAIIGYGYSLGNIAYGYVAVGKFLGDFFSEILYFLFNPITLSIIVLWIGYQIYYFISYNSDRKEKNEYSKESNRYIKKINFKKILFFFSILCWGIYFASAIWALFFGYDIGFFNSRRIYGIEALTNALFWNLLSFSIIPVLPISLLYIIIYLIVKNKEEKSNNIDY